MKSRTRRSISIRASLFLQVEISEQFTYEREHLLMGLSYALAKAARADRGLNDRDLIAALTAMCTSYERLVNSGLHYQQPVDRARAACDCGTSGDDDEAVS